MNAPPLAGKPRSFGRGFGLTVITFGFYALYWWIKAYKEVYDQERRNDHPIVLAILVLIPFVGIVTGLMYISKVLGVLNDAREARKMPRIFGLGGYILWSLIPIAGIFIVYAKMTNALNEYWEAEARGRSVTPATPPTTPPAMQEVR